MSSEAGRVRVADSDTAAASPSSFVAGFDAPGLRVTYDAALIAAARSKFVAVQKSERVRRAADALPGTKRSNEFGRHRPTEVTYVLDGIRVAGRV
jgi:hypothetical protein